MDRQIIKAEKKYTFLNEFMNELPVNCLFDKGKTGCGGTTIAIEDKKNTIIVMPYVNVIKNKMAQYPNEKCDKELFGIYEGVTDRQILDHIKNNKIKKIAVTYDSLEKLINLLYKETEIDVYNEFFLLVDEWHILFNSYAFRNKAIRGILQHAKQFKEVTYMTATPIEEEFILKELKDLPVIEVQWEDVTIVDVKPIVTNQPIRVVCELIKDVLDDKIFGNLHFFVNSVEFIADAIQETGLQPERVRIVCSKNEKQGKGKKSNQKKLGDNFTIEDTTTQVKKINFYTSTSFEGCDIYDENGKTYIVSDKGKSHTLLDISTLIIQICGRIRDSHYKTKMGHIFSETRYNKFLSLEEFKDSTYKQLFETKDWLNSINQMDDVNRKKTINLIERNNKSGLNEMYIYNENDRLEIDENLVNLDIVNFKITNHLYQNRITLKEEYTKYGFNVLKEVNPKLSTDKLAENSKAKISFKDLFEEYILIVGEESNYYYFGNKDDRKSLIEDEKPLIKEAHEKLGVEKVRELKYNVTNIKRAICNMRTDLSLDTKIVTSLKEKGVSQGTTATINEWKKLLQSIYDSLELRNSNGLIKKAKATDLDNWFEIKKTTPKINGKTTDCYTIVRCKFIYD
ncbi:DEAD/DEAH box helicase family protein [Dysgonomonas sp. ZJ279]|uniref:DEAD/DEAH box helicase family protein n=1 Tax=Dysgonomonas sp. ZJ279 TaxID=2709796 RepID=UPI0013EB6174|nr:DEAD/DEAH box helicase family protein [Dysgonomonas sp. ZJ279]